MTNAIGHTMPDLAEFLKVYGPLAMGWVVAVYLVKFILDRYDRDIDSRNNLAVSLKGLTDIIRERE